MYVFLVLSFFPLVCLAPISLVARETGELVTVINSLFYEAIK